MFHGWKQGIRLYLKISKDLIPLILLGGFWFVHIRGAYDKFADFFRMGTFSDSTYLKL